jgi:hypothetical protein
VTAVPGSRSALVRWSPPADDGGSNVIRYLVRTRNAGGNVVGTSLSVRAPATRAVVRGLTNGNRYRFQVAAVTRSGRGPYSRLSNAVRPATALGPR